MLTENLHDKESEGTSSPPLQGLFGLDIGAAAGHKREEQLTAEKDWTKVLFSEWRQGQCVFIRAYHNPKKDIIHPQYYKNTGKTLIRDCPHVSPHAAWNSRAENIHAGERALNISSGWSLCLFSCAAMFSISQEVLHLRLSPNTSSYLDCKASQSRVGPIRPDKLLKLFLLNQPCFFPPEHQHPSGPNTTTRDSGFVSPLLETCFYGFVMSVYWHVLVFDQEPCCISRSAVHPGGSDVISSGSAPPWARRL